MRTTSRRLSVALGLLVAVTLSGGIATAVTRSSDSGPVAGGTDVVAAGGAHLQGVNGVTPDPFADDLPVPPPSTTTIPAATTVAPPITVPTTTTTAPAPPPTAPALPPTTAPPTTQGTVAPPPTPPSTVAPGPAPATATYSLSPPSGPANTTVTLRGTGCVAGGSPTGIELTIYDPSGRPINGDGGAALADGSWTLPTSFYAVPGVYTLRARCAVTNGHRAVFDYPAATFTVTG